MNPAMDAAEPSFTPENSISLPMGRWLSRSDLSPCSCGRGEFDVVRLTRLVRAERLNPEHWGEPTLSVQCRDCFDPEKRPAWERGRIREVVLGSIDMITGVYTETKGGLR